MSGMTQAIVAFLQTITDNHELLTFLSSLIPLIELKGAIPVGVNLGLPIFSSAFYAYLGSTLVAVPVFFLLIPVFGLLKKIPFVSVLVEKLEAMLKGKAAKMAQNRGGNAEQTEKRMLALGLFVFVAIPLPITGVWTGTAIAVFLGMKFANSFLPLAIGNLVAGLLVTLLILAVGKDRADLILNIVLILAAIMLVVTIIKIATAKPEDGGAGGKGGKGGKN